MKATPYRQAVLLAVGFGVWTGVWLGCGEEEAADPCALVEYEMGEGLRRGDGLVGVGRLFFVSEQTGPELSPRRGGERLELTLRYEDLEVCRDRFAPRWFEVFDVLVSQGRPEARETLQLILWSGAYRDRRFEGRLARVIRELAVRDGDGGDGDWGGEVDWGLVHVEWTRYSGLWRELVRVAGPSLFAQLVRDGWISPRVLWRIRDALAVELAKVPSGWSLWAEGVEPVADIICGAEPPSRSARAALEWEAFVRVWLPSTLGVVCPIHPIQAR
ncbi:MAG TPA: hypothetical protein PK095_10830 [Myxococcota bacterium]|nr:hypothetical protein [Myxococcota bacterium]